MIRQEGWFTGFYRRGYLFRSCLWIGQEISLLFATSIWSCTAAIQIWLISFHHLRLSAAANGTQDSEIKRESFPPDAESNRRALGNSMAVPVMRWIGERIAVVHEIVSGKRFS